MTSDAGEGRVPLDDGETVVRYVGGAHVDRGTGKINGSAFDRTAKDTDGLSLTRRHILAIERDADRQAIRRIMASRLTLGRTAVFVELNVGAILECLVEFGQPILLREDPRPADGTKLANPAHALLIGLPFVGESVGSLKSELAGDRLKHQITSTFPAVL